MTDIGMTAGRNGPNAFQFRTSQAGAAIGPDAAGGTARALSATCAEYEDKIANLETALRTNRRIGIAIGIVMARDRCTDDEAFDMLRELSQHRNRKLRELAEEVIYTGAFPD